MDKIIDSNYVEEQVPFIFDEEKYADLFPGFFNYFLKDAAIKLVNRTKAFRKNPQLNLNSIIDGILHGLSNKLQSLCLRTLILDLHLYKNSHLLVGDTKWQRYDYFAHVISKQEDYIKELLADYPVLDRLIQTTINQTIDNNLLILEQFIKDSSNINKHFLGNFQKLEKINNHLGDTHNKGKTVSIITFGSGDKLIYKPRSLSVDYHFKNLLTWINDMGFKYPLYSPMVLTSDNDEYGWAEFIEYKPCESINDINRFYYRKGAYIALLYILGSSDFHVENLIAHNDQPILVDLETIFSKQHEMGESFESQSKILNELNHSVFASMMLPLQLYDNLPLDFEMSGIGGAEGQVSDKIKHIVIKESKTDNMYLAEQSTTFIGGENRPTYNNQKVEAYQYVDDVLDGFTEIYQLFRKHYEKLFAEGGALTAFSTVPIRQVFRPTQVYGKLLESSTHPDYLQSEQKRSELFLYLKNMTEHIPNFTRILQSEMDDLYHHDVPYFLFNVENKDLMDSEGNITQAFFNKSELSLIKEKCLQLNDDDLDKQRHYIKMSLATLIKDPWDTSSNPSEAVVVKSEQSMSSPLQRAIDIGEHIYNTTIISNKNEATWLNLNFNNDGGLDLSLSGLDLYNGVLGYTLFLGQLAKETNTPKYKKLARKSLNTVLNTINDHSYTPSSVSAFSGHFSIIYSLFYLSKLWDDKELLDKCYELFPSIDSLSVEDEEMDLIAGLSGAIIVSLQFYKHTSFKQALNVANQYGMEIVKRLKGKKLTDMGLLTGFSHGVSGICWALLELYSMTKNHTYFDTAQTLLSHERRFYNKQSKNWKDLRSSTKEGLDPVYWCHGAPGIGLSRVFMKNLVQDSQMYDEIDIAIEKIIEQPFIESDCLCHGSLGNLDILLTMEKNHKSPSLQSKIDEIGSVLMSKKDWVYGLHKHAEMQGFFLGITGIGYSLLRLNNPNIPSVLALQLPE